MAASNWHDEALVANFLQLKSSVLALCGNDPSTVESMASGDEPFRQLCLQLDHAALQLGLSEDSAAGGFISPVNQSFIREWRDFEERLRVPLAGIFLAGLGFSAAEGERATKEEISDDEAKRQANDLRSLIQYLEDRSRDANDEEFGKFLDEGLSAWRDLVSKAGLDLRGVFRRAQMAPSVLVPPHVAKKYGPQEENSLYAKWIDARRAFIFGALHASIAMNRATLEQILLDGYGLSTKNLYQAIEQLRNIDTPDIIANIHRIRIIARFLLHAEQDAYRKSEWETIHEAKILDEAKFNLEREVAAALHVLRQLIERVPLTAAPIKSEINCEK